MSRNNALQPLLGSFAAHPYLWTLAICLCCEPFLFGSSADIESYAQSFVTIVVLAITAGFGFYVLRRGGRTEYQIIVFGICAALAASLMARQYSRAQDVTDAWGFVMPWAIIIAVLIGLAAAATRHAVRGSRRYRRRMNCLMILGMCFLLKLLYVVLTTVYTRQHDIDSFDLETGHAGYIEYLLANRALPDFDVRDVWQYYHPPLHHAISACWIFFNENVLLLGRNAARESLQTLTLFYSMCIVITSYRLLRQFKLNGWALYVPLIIVSFHPTFTIFSGSINNDVLSAAFIVGAIYCTVRWYADQTMGWILKIALCVGLGMMTKLAAGLVAIPIAFVFLVALYKRVKEKTDWKRLMIQFVCFLLVCVPLGTWFGIRNYIGWGVPITYVPMVRDDIPQYLGRMDYISRITDFSAEQFSTPYVQWNLYPSGHTEYNPLIALLKSSVFGEFTILGDGQLGLVPQINAVLGRSADTIAFALLWVNVVLACFAFVAMIVTCVSKSTVERTVSLALALYGVAMLVSFYQMAAEFPHTCTMNYRYVSPTVIIGSVFIGLFLRKSAARNTKGAKLLTFCTSLAAFLFAVLSEIVYVSVS